MKRCSQAGADLDLVNDHRFVCKVNNWLGDGQCERSQPGTIASYENERLHVVASFRLTGGPSSEFTSTRTMPGTRLIVDQIIGCYTTLSTSSPLQAG